MQYGNVTSNFLCGKSGQEFSPGAIFPFPSWLQTCSHCHAVSHCLFGCVVLNVTLIQQYHRHSLYTMHKHLKVKVFGRGIHVTPWVISVELKKKTLYGNKINICAHYMQFTQQGQDVQVLFRTSIDLTLNSVWSITLESKMPQPGPYDKCIQVSPPPKHKPYPPNLASSLLLIIFEKFGWATFHPTYLTREYTMSWLVLNHKACIGFVIGISRRLICPAG